MEHQGGTTMTPTEFIAAYRLSFHYRVSAPDGWDITIDWPEDNFTWLGYLDDERLLPLSPANVLSQLAQQCACCERYASIEDLVAIVTGPEEERQTAREAYAVLIRLRNTIRERMGPEMYTAFLTLAAPTEEAADA